MLLTILLSAGATAFGFLSGFYLGHTHGVIETEGRWHEAVTRANYSRET